MIQNTKHHIKTNTKHIKEIETSVQNGIKENEALLKAFAKKNAPTPRGTIPQYLVERKKQQEVER